MGINPQAYNYSLCIRLLLIVALFLVLISCEKEYDFSKVEAFMQNTTLGDEIIPGRDPTDLFIAKHTHSGVAPERGYLPTTHSCKNHFLPYPEVYDFHIGGTFWACVGSPDLYRVIMTLPVDFNIEYVNGTFDGDKQAAIEHHLEIAVDLEVRKTGREPDAYYTNKEKMIIFHVWYIDERYSYKMALSYPKGTIAYVLEIRSSYTD